jgi:hypothetical protein
MNRRVLDIIQNLVLILISLFIFQIYTSKYGRNEFKNLFEPRIPKIMGDLQIVQLNLSGKKITSTKETLSQVPYFKQIFEDNVPTLLDGSIFIDRPFVHFNEILRFLQTRFINEDLLTNEEFLNELKFYRLDPKEINKEIEQREREKQEISRREWEEKVKIEKEIKLQKEIERKKSTEERIKSCENKSEFNFEVENRYIFTFSKEILDKFPNSVFSESIKPHCLKDRYNDIVLPFYQEEVNLFSEYVNGHKISKYERLDEIETIFQKFKIEFKILKTFNIFINKNSGRVVKSDVSPNNIYLYKFMDVYFPIEDIDHREIIFNHIGLTNFVEIDEFKKYTIIQYREIDEFEIFFKMINRDGQYSSNYLIRSSIRYPKSIPNLSFEEELALSTLWKTIQEQKKELKLIETKSIWFPKKYFRIHSDGVNFLKNDSPHCLKKCGLNPRFLPTPNFKFLTQDFGYIADSDSVPLKCSDFFISQETMKYAVENHFHKKLNSKFQEYYEVPLELRNYEWINYIQSNSNISIEFSKYSTLKINKG